MKYICIALPCSGLRKIEQFFKSSSLNYIKNPHDKSIADLSSYDAVIDTAGNFSPDELMAAFPDAAVFTTRPQDDWEDRFTKWVERGNKRAMKIRRKRFGDNLDHALIRAEHDDFVKREDVQVFGEWMESNDPVTPSSSKMFQAKVTALLLNNVINSQGYHALVEYLQSRDVWVDTYPINQWDSHFGSARNLITWGVKRSNDDYKNKDRRVLFIENGIHRQKPAFYMDNMGYSDGSSLVQESGNIAPYTQEEEMAAIRFIKDKLKHDFNKPAGRSTGPILVALQTTNDAPLKFHFPLSENYTGEKDQVWRIRHFLNILKENLPVDIPVVVRQHPKDQRFPEDFEMPANWSMSDLGPVLDEIRSARAVVTVNSTVVTEALSLGVPVATLGTGCFSGSHATLECADDPKLVQGVLSRPWYRENALRYLCAIHRYHNVPYRGKTDAWYRNFFENNEPLNEWIDSLHQNPQLELPLPAPEPSPSGRMVTCIFCACRVLKTGCAKCKCSNCNQPNF